MTPSELDEQRFEPALARMRALRTGLWVWLLAGFVATYLAAAVARSVASPAIWTLSVVAHVVGVFARGLRVLSFRCPRCVRLFFWRGLFRNPFATACMSCGLPDRAPSDHR